jgi:hypothetical protein
MDADEILGFDADEGARLVDFAECPRIGDWTLRSALVRYAQRSPVAASAVLELVRRTDAALQPHRRALERTPVAEVVADGDSDPAVLDLLVVAAVLDELGAVLSAWADDRAAIEAPVERVDALASRAFGALAELGVAREARPPRRAG